MGRQEPVLGVTLALELTCNGCSNVTQKLLEGSLLEQKLSALLLAKVCYSVKVYSRPVNGLAFMV